MKRSLIAAAVLGLMATTAQAENVVPLYDSKDSLWGVYQWARNVHGHAMCDMRTAFHFNRGNGYIFLKVNSEGHVQFHVGKDGWKFTNGAVVPFRIQFDNNVHWDVKGVAIADDLISVSVTGDGIPAFLDAIRTSDLMQLQFAKGNEKPWTAKMIGSRKATDIFWKCAKDIGALDALTEQPGTEEPTKPATDNNRDKFRGA